MEGGVEGDDASAKDSGPVNEASHLSGQGMDVCGYCSSLALNAAFSLRFAPAWAYASATVSLADTGMTCGVGPHMGYVQLRTGNERATKVQVPARHRSMSVCSVSFAACCLQRVGTPGYTGTKRGYTCTRCHGSSRASCGKWGTSGSNRAFAPPVERSNKGKVPPLFSVNQITTFGVLARVPPTAV